MAPLTRIDRAGEKPQAVRNTRNDAMGWVGTGEGEGLFLPRRYTGAGERVTDHVTDQAVAGKGRGPRFPHNRKFPAALFGKSDADAVRGFEDGWCGRVSDGWDV